MRVVLITVIACAGVLVCQGSGLPVLASCLVSVALAVVSVRDIDERVVPNDWLLFAAAVQAGYLAAASLGVAGVEGVTLPQGAADIDASSIGRTSGASPAALWLEFFLGAAVTGGFPLAAGLIASAISARPSLGGGDVKLFALAGFCLGWRRGLVVLLLSCLFALPAAAWQRRIDRRAGRAFDGTFPFAPSICLAFWLMLLAGG